MDDGSVPARTARPLPDGVRARMEAAFGADFSDVMVREDGGPAAVDAVALTQGSQIAFQPGAYDPHTAEGLEAIGHELAHVLQQREGRVQGSGLTEDPVLEAEADAVGRRAAHGEPVPAASGRDGGPAPTAVAQPAGPLSRVKRAIAKRLGRSGRPQQAPESETAGLRSPTEALERLRLRAIQQTIDYVRAPNGEARQAAKAAIDQTMQDILDEQDIYHGTPGRNRELAALHEQIFAPLIAENAERARVEGLFAPGESETREPQYFRTPVVGPDVNVPGTEPSYIQTPAPPAYGLAPPPRRRPGE